MIDATDHRRTTMSRVIPPVLVLAGSLWSIARAQTTGTAPEWQPITREGVPRASAVVDSVYVDRTSPADTVPGGDFTAYLMARLGITQLPPDFGFRVAVDTVLLRLGGRVGDIPPEARTALGPLTAWLGDDTWLEAHVVLLGAGPAGVRFHLREATIQGVPVPEPLLASVMRDVGVRYPALTRTGRDLLVAIPSGAAMQLVPGGVALLGP